MPIHPPLHLPSGSGVVRHLPTRRTGMPARLAASALAIALQALAPPATAATPFDTPGPFVQYSLDGSAKQQVTTFGTDWLRATGTPAPGTTVQVDGQGGIGVARIGLQTSGPARAFAWAGWNDTLTVAAANPALNGTAGVLAFDLQASWSASIAGTAHATSAFVDVSLIAPGRSIYAVVTEDIAHSCTAAGACGATWTWAQGQGMAPPTFADGVARFRVPIVFGQPYTVVIGMNATVGGDGTQVVDATHSLHWGGITAVTTPQGAAVAHQVLSGSGVDYLQPHTPAVPEPSAPWLISAGLGLQAWRLRRQAGTARLRRRPPAPSPACP